MAIGIQVQWGWEVWPKLDEALSMLSFSVPPVKSGFAPAPARKHFQHTTRARVRAPPTCNHAANLSKGPAWQLQGL
jgi:hypothetical protein